MEEAAELVVKDGEEYLGIGALAKRYGHTPGCALVDQAVPGPGKGGQPMPEPAVTIRQDNRVRQLRLEHRPASGAGPVGQREHPGQGPVVTVM